jgi:hypothetical protein
MKKFFLLIIMIFFINPAFATTNNNCNSHEVPVQNFTEDYPVVTQMESKLFGQSYAKEDIYNRLNRLETHLFGKTSQGDLSDRVDKLSESVLKDNDNSQDKTYTAENNDDDESLGPSDEDGSFNELLTDLEQKLLNQTFIGDTQESRIARLERTVFNSSSDGYSKKERIDRIAAVVKAQPSGDLFKDTAQLQKFQTAGQGVALITLILMIIAGIVL